MSAKMKPPVLFTCGQNVMMPQVGADERLPSPQAAPLTPSITSPRKHSNGVNKTYVKKISADILFSEDVVRERGFHTLPYSTKYLDEALDFSDIISLPPKSSVSGGRHNNRISRVNHMPCHLHKKATHRLKPMKRKILERAAEMYEKSLQEEEKQQQTTSETETAQDELSTLHESDVKEPLKFHDKKVSKDDDSDTSSVTDSMYVTPPQLQHEWDEYLLSILSSNTAQWIVSQSVPPGAHNDRLTALLLEQHGPIPEEPELVPDNVSESEHTHGKEQQVESKKKWKKGESTLLERVRDAESLEKKQTDPYGDKTEASFYRLPAGIRKAKKHQHKEEAGAINSTAFNVQVPVRKESPPPTIRDFINPKAGDKLYETSNAFQQERLTGVSQVYDRHGDQGHIILTNNNKYVKVLQHQSPRPPDVWHSTTEGELLQAYKPEKQKPTKRTDKGLHRWKALPVPLNDSIEAMIVSQNGYEAEITPRTTVEPADMSLLRNNTSLTKIIEDWRSKWHLDSRFADANPDDLVRDMADIHPHIRLKAIATCARAAEYRPPPEMGIQIDAPTENRKPVSILPEKLFIALECLLDDPHPQIQRAAAITLYTLERPTPDAESILRRTLQKDKSVDRWAAAQCLAHFGVCDSDVVGELVNQLMNSEEVLRHEQATRMLTKLSINSTLPHSMLAEQLNSSSWRHKVLVCRALPKLHGSVNKDIMNKLTNLMWNDWHGEVRKASAQALGRTGHGKTVHNQLREKILNGLERERVEAVAKIGHLGIMTAKLLPVYLDCFSDEYVSVRQETCTTAGNLKIQEKEVIDKLLHLATYDPIWKVKALAIQALGKIGLVTPQVRNCLLWALRYEDQAGVRAEAVRAVHVMGLHDTDVVQILQDRFLVETSSVVKEEITNALGVFDINPTEDMDTVNQIKDEVRKLCTRDNICAHITRNEDLEDQENNMKRLIYQPPPVQKDDIVVKAKTVSRASTRSPAVAVTPEPSSMVGLSREGTMYTPTADDEVKAILSSSDKMGRSSPETVTSSRTQTYTYTGTDSNTYKTRTTTALSCPSTPGRHSHLTLTSRTSTQVGEDSISRTTTKSHDMSGLTRYRMDDWEEGIDLSDPTDQTHQTDTRPKLDTRESTFEVTQTYVEIVADPDHSAQQDESMENVIQITYESPDLKTPSKNFTEDQKEDLDSQNPVSVETVVTEDGANSAKLNTEENAREHSHKPSTEENPREDTHETSAEENAKEDSLTPDAEKDSGEDSQKPSAGDNAEEYQTQIEQGDKNDVGYKEE